MLFHENRLLADDSHEISCFFRILGKMSQNILSAAVVIGALRAYIIDGKSKYLCPMFSLTYVKRFRIICIFIIRFIKRY